MLSPLRPCRRAMTILHARLSRPMSPLSTLPDGPGLADFIVSSAPPRKDPPASNSIELLGLSLDEIRQIIIEKAPKLLANKSYLPQQIVDAVYRQGVCQFDGITTLSKPTREALSQIFHIDHMDMHKQLVSTDGTTKWLLGYGTAANVEAVFIPKPQPDTPAEEVSGTVCISSQVGCSLSCSFCHTGTQKLLRNLTAGEILSQVMHSMRQIGDYPLARAKARQISNIVLMGQGEPLYNFRAVSKAVKLMQSQLRFTPWRITLSTSGVVPLMGRISEDLQCGLAVSLHAVTDELRDVLVPINKTYNITDLMRGCNAYLGGMKQNKHRRITFEYVMLDGVNDSPSEARQLARLISALPAHVNLLPFNPWPGSIYRTSPDRRVIEFAEIIRSKGIHCNIRTPRGRDIMAACGQLRSSEELKARAKE
ncbi:cfr family radical SAM enzyme [Polychytrium aggregatum]|uniref:cfr family radical SAM enzyme n=1 Tax=Polychytrium aggregatum TaxID=110093 RepID=UPI0022FDD220|nr:cfr family radical SAM enzyme [Polychytrium aggregatum]KAI9206413.1 cfr family radical SAM enzyme [Polychytrium aggregatum]